MAAQGKPAVIFPEFPCLFSVGVGEALPVDPGRIADDKVELVFADKDGGELVFKKPRPDPVASVGIEPGDAGEYLDEQFFGIGFERTDGGAEFTITLPVEPQPDLENK